MRAYVCQTPKDKCTAGTRTATKGLRQAIKAHSTSKEAYQCYAHYLVRVLGYTAFPNHEFHKEGEPTIVLTRKSKYGGALCGGKTGGEGGGGKSKHRVTPRRATHGIIIG